MGGEREVRPVMKTPVGGEREVRPVMKTPVGGEASHEDPSGR